MCSVICIQEEALLLEETQQLSRQTKDLINTRLKIYLVCKHNWTHTYRKEYRIQKFIDIDLSHSLSLSLTLSRSLSLSWLGWGFSKMTWKLRYTNELDLIWICLKLLQSSLMFVLNHSDLTQPSRLNTWLALLTSDLTFSAVLRLPKISLK